MKCNRCYKTRITGRDKRSVLEQIDCKNKLGNKQLITIASYLTKYSKNVNTLSDSTEHTAVFVTTIGLKDLEANTHSRTSNGGIK